MNPSTALTLPRVRSLLRTCRNRRVLVIGDVMLDQFIWGHVRRISPEAPVPVVEFQRESFMPGGAANVARNLTSLGARATLCGFVGEDHAAGHLASILAEDGVDCGGLVRLKERPTGLKTRIIAGQQHVVRIDRERRGPPTPADADRLIVAARRALAEVDAVVLGDYAKGAIFQELVEELKKECHTRGIWLSADPKPINGMRLDGLSLVTPNRKEAFELAGLEDSVHADNPLADSPLLAAVEHLLAELQPALLLITLSAQGLLLCRRGCRPVHIPTAAQEVFDVSGAGDTMIASFTLAIAAGAAPLEAAVFSNHAAGVVVGKVGTATVTPAELLASFQRPERS